MAWERVSVSEGLVLSAGGDEKKKFPIENDYRWPHNYNPPFLLEH